MNTESNVKRLDATPVAELNLGSASLRRAIIKAGFNSLPDLLNLSGNEIDSLFEPREADKIIRQRDEYRKNPERFAASVLQSHATENNSATSAGAPLETKPSHRTPRRTDAGTTVLSSLHFSTDGPTSLPALPFSQSLKAYERRARKAFDDLDDRFQNVMAYQAFEEFPTDLDELSAAFGELFAYYSTQPRDALKLIDGQLRNVFVIYVADRARNVISDGNLWGNFFTGAKGFARYDDNIKSLFKQTFVKQVERRGMPLYGHDEEANYYYYTALLHGGLSADSWSNLWEKSILPLARKLAEGDYGFGTEMNGRSILKELKNPDSPLAPKKAVLNILEKAPDATIAPLFESAMSVAAQVVSSRVASGYTMLSSFGLPETAMEALRKKQEKTATSAVHKHGSSSRKQQDGHRLIYLPMAKLQLDLAIGAVSIHWPSQQFPTRFNDDRIDYYVDGIKKQSSSFDASVGKCILPAASITVEPQARYDIELKYMKKNEGTGNYEEVSSLHQKFTRNKPGCFEFIMDAQGLFRLRESNEMITRKRRIAYIVKDGYRVSPGQGMTPISEHETSGSWEGTQIIVFDVDPGSSGSVVDMQTGEEIAVWRECYTTKIDKTQIIGETVDGVDLYGYAPCEEGTNGGLPIITIEATEGKSALDDLVITCTCDDRRVSIPHPILWEDESDGSGPAQIALIPQKAIGFDGHVADCLIEARQKSAGGKAVFKYKFAVVPIQDFKPNAISINLGTAVAEYDFQAVRDIDVINEQQDVTAVDAWNRYTAKTLLKDEFLHVRIRSREQDRETDAKLALAAIDIDIPKSLSSISEERPICLADVIELGCGAANMKITSYGWRYNRAVIVWIGQEPIFFKKLKYPGEHVFNPFTYASSFLQDDDSLPREKPLKLSLVYGNETAQNSLKPAWTDVKLLDCEQGIGIHGWKLRVTSDGAHILHFDGRPVCNAHFEFKVKMNEKEKTVAKASVSAGDETLVLPSNVAKLLDTHRAVVVEVSPTDWFDDPLSEYTVRFNMRR